MEKIVHVDVQFPLETNMPPEIHNLIYSLLGRTRTMDGAKELGIYAEHPFFLLPRWQHVMNGDVKAQFVGRSALSWQDGVLWLRISNSMRDTGETRVFLSLLHHLIALSGLTYLGTIKTEGEDHPELVYYMREEILFIQTMCDEVMIDGQVKRIWDLEES